MAISARPDAAAQNANTQDEHRDGDGEREQVEPLVRADRQAERRAGLTMTMPWTPPVQCSMPLYFRICGVATASAKVASAR